MITLIYYFRNTTGAKLEGCTCWGPEKEWIKNKWTKYENKWNLGGIVEIIDYFEWKDGRIFILEATGEKSRK